MQSMAEKKPKPGKRAGKNLFPGFQLRLHPRIREQLETLANRNATNISDEIRTAVREYLERASLWPPPADPS